MLFGGIVMVFVCFCNNSELENPNNSVYCTALTLKTKHSVHCESLQ